MPIREYRSDPLGQGLFWVTGLVFFVSAIFGVYLFHTALAGPTALERAKSWEVDESEVIGLMEQSIESEADFDREWKKNPENREVFKALEKAIGYQRRLRALDPENAFGSVSRLNELLRKLEDTKGRALYSEARRLSEKAELIVAQGDSMSAIPLLEQALSDHEWINTHLREGDLVDLGEVSRLRQKLASLQTVDAVDEVDQFYEKGKVAYAEGNFDVAEVLFERAITIQESINLNLPESSHVRWRLVQELKDFQRRIEAGRMNERVEALLKAAEQGVPGDHLERALNLQAVLNERYSTTEYRNLKRLEYLKSTVATGLSEANAALLLEQSGYLSELLRQKNWSGVHTSLLELEGALDEFLSQFPEALLPVAELPERVGWLTSIEPRLEELGQLAASRLVKHPGQDLLINASEVDQKLFELVMDTNPSRWPGENNPVDSVNFPEAQKFCQRLGWALGRPVVLPRASWVSYYSERISNGDNFWFSENSRFQSQPVRTSPATMGVYDLFGNLAEWVTDEDGMRAAGLFGGSGTDSWNSVRDSPLNMVAENFRSRWAGFRFCVLD